MRSIALLLWSLLLWLPAHTQATDKQAERITTLLYQQQAAWNSGDIDAFMQVYWQSEALQFGGAKGITRGWQQTLEGYKKAIPTKPLWGN
ncbi:MAG: hypothetical protein R2795_26685 [Saprospiraceae bacterium]